MDPFSQNYGHARDCIVNPLHQKLSFLRGWLCFAFRWHCFQWLLFHLANERRFIREFSGEVVYTNPGSHFVDIMTTRTVFVDQRLDCRNTSTGGSALASNWTDPNAIPINRIRRNKRVVFDMSFWR